MLIKGFMLHFSEFGLTEITCFLKQKFIDFNTTPTSIIYRPETDENGFEPVTFGSVFYPKLEKGSKLEALWKLYCLTT